MNPTFKAYAEPIHEAYALTATLKRKADQVASWPT